ncbi:hypothetical protein ACFL4A_00465 [bacterium]
MNLRIKKIISSVLLSAFLFSLSGLQHAYAAVGAAVSPSHLVNRELILSPEHGRILETYQGTGDKAFICIQDLHCHQEVQNNIDQILESVKETYGKNLKVVNVEGAWGELDTSLIEVVPAGFGVREAIIDDLMKRGSMTGAEKFGIKHGDAIKLVGSEKADIYHKDGKLLYSSLAVREDAVAGIGLIREKLDSYKAALYPKSLANFEKFLAKYKKGDMNIVKYISGLKSEAESLGIAFELKYPNMNKVLLLAKQRMRLARIQAIQSEAMDVERLLDRNLKKDQKARLASFRNEGTDKYYIYLMKLVNDNNFVIKNTFVLLDQYFKYLEISMTINTAMLVDEEIRAQYEVRDLLANTKPSKDLLYLDKYTLYLEHFVSNAITLKEEKEYLSEEKNYFNKLRSFIRENRRDMAWEYAVTSYLRIIQKAVRIMKNFYDVAEERNQYLAKNTLKTKKETNLNVLVAGGYHTEGITQILRSLGVSYVLITPNITQDVDSSIYHDRLQEQAQTNNYISVGSKPQAFAINSMFQGQAFNQAGLQGIFGQFREVEGIVAFLNKVNTNTQTPDDIAAAFKSVIEHYLKASGLTEQKIGGMLQELAISITKRFFGGNDESKMGLNITEGKVTISASAIPAITIDFSGYGAEAVGLRDEGKVDSVSGSRGGTNALLDVTTRLGLSPATAMSEIAGMIGKGESNIAKLGLNDEQQRALQAISSTYVDQKGEMSINEYVVLDNISKVDWNLPIEWRDDNTLLITKNSLDAFADYKASVSEDRFNAHLDYRKEHERVEAEKYGEIFISVMVTESKENITIEQQVEISKRIHAYAITSAKEQSREDVDSLIQKQFSDIRRQLALQSENKLTSFQGAVEAYKDLLRTLNLANLDTKSLKDQLSTLRTLASEILSPVGTRFVLIELTEAHGEAAALIKELEDRKLLENGRLKDKVQVVFRGDAAILKTPAGAVDAIQKISALAPRGMIEFVVGPQTTNAMAKIGEAKLGEEYSSIRNLQDADVLKIATLGPDGSIITGGGVITQEFVNQYRAIYPDDKFSQPSNRKIEFITLMNLAFAASTIAVKVNNVEEINNQLLNLPELGLVKGSAGYKAFVEGATSGELLGSIVSKLTKKEATKQAAKGLQQTVVYKVDDVQTTSIFYFDEEDKPEVFEFTTTAALDYQMADVKVSVAGKPDEVVLQLQVTATDANMQIIKEVKLAPAIELPALTGAAKVAAEAVKLGQPISRGMSMFTKWLNIAKKKKGRGLTQEKLKKIARLASMA